MIMVSSEGNFDLSSLLRASSLSCDLESKIRLNEGANLRAIASPIPDVHPVTKAQGLLLPSLVTKEVRSTLPS